MDVIKPGISRNDTNVQATQKSVEGLYDQMNVVLAKQDTILDSDEIMDDAQEYAIIMGVIA